MLIRSQVFPVLRINDAYEIYASLSQYLTLVTDPCRLNAENTPAELNPV
jgi:hypothetical protein